MLALLTRVIFSAKWVVDVLCIGDAPVGVVVPLCIADDDPVELGASCESGAGNLGTLPEYYVVADCSFSSGEIDGAEGAFLAS